MKSYEQLLKEYEQDGVIPVAHEVFFAQWVRGHRPRACPYCYVMFSVNLAKDADHIIHCPVCCMEIEYEKEEGGF
jgi:hypothetical protein